MRHVIKCALIQLPPPVAGVWGLGFRAEVLQLCDGSKALKEWGSTEECTGKVAFGLRFEGIGLGFRICGFGLRAQGEERP
jgi:hypothetical protein